MFRWSLVGVSRSRILVVAAASAFPVWSVDAFPRSALECGVEGQVGWSRRNDGQECVKFKEAELVDVVVSKACHSAIPSSLIYPSVATVGNVHSPVLLQATMDEKLLRMSEKKENALPVNKKSLVPSPLKPHYRS